MDHGAHSNSITIICGEHDLVVLLAHDENHMLPLFTSVTAGVVDPLGIMPLLRRGVKNIIACVAIRTSPSLSMHQFAIGENVLQHPIAPCTTKLGFVITVDRLHKQSCRTTVRKQNEDLGLGCISFAAAAGSCPVDCARALCKSMHHFACLWGGAANSS